MNAAAQQSILTASSLSPIVVITSSTTPADQLLAEQVPQLFLTDVVSHQRILCTQPRRKAAVQLAERVAAQRSESVGETVGFQIRDEHRHTERTRLTYATTGALRRRLQDDAALPGVTLVVVGEAHDETDEETRLMWPLLKEALAKRTDLRVILLTSAEHSERIAASLQLGADVNKVLEI